MSDHRMRLHKEIEWQKQGVKCKHCARFAKKNRALVCPHMDRTAESGACYAAKIRRETYRALTNNRSGK